MPSLTNYERGRRFEVRCQHELEAQGWEVCRAAGSKGSYDLVALRGTPQGALVQLIQCKLNGKASPAERESLKLLASELRAEAVLASREGRAIRWVRIQPPAGIK